MALNDHLLPTSPPFHGRLSAKFDLKEQVHVNLPFLRLLSILLCHDARAVFSKAIQEHDVTRPAQSDAQSSGGANVASVNNMAVKRQDESEALSPDHPGEGRTDKVCTRALSTAAAVLPATQPRQSRQALIIDLEVIKIQSGSRDMYILRTKVYSRLLRNPLRLPSSNFIASRPNVFRVCLAHTGHTIRTLSICANVRESCHHNTPLSAEWKIDPEFILEATVLEVPITPSSERNGELGVSVDGSLVSQMRFDLPDCPSTHSKWHKHPAPDPSLLHPVSSALSRSNRNCSDQSSFCGRNELSRPNTQHTVASKAQPTILRQA